MFYDSNHKLDIVYTINLNQNYTSFLHLYLSALLQFGELFYL